MPEKSKHVIKQTFCTYTLEMSKQVLTFIVRFLGLSYNTKGFTLPLRHK